MFSVLEVAFRRDPVAGERFGAGQRQIMFIISLRVLRAPGVGPVESGSLGLPELRSSPYCAVRNFRCLARPCRRLLEFSGGFHMGPYAAG